MPYYNLVPLGTDTNVHNPPYQFVAGSTAGQTCSANSSIILHYVSTSNTPFAVGFDSGGLYNNTKFGLYTGSTDTFIKGWSAFMTISNANLSTVSVTLALCLLDSSGTYVSTITSTTQTVPAATSIYQVSVSATRGFPISNSTYGLGVRLTNNDAALLVTTNSYTTDFSTAQY